MSLQAKKTYVMRITYPISGNVSYFTDWPGLALDGEVYQNIVTGWGSIGYYTDTLDGTFQRGSFDIQIANGQRIQGESFAISPTSVWNNATCEIRLYTVGYVIFEQCLPIVTGKIKNFNINNDMIGFSVEPVDSRDDILLPTIVCEDNSDLSDANAKKTILFTDNNDRVYFSTGEASIFKIGELVLLHFDTAQAGANNTPYQYAKIKAIDSTNSNITLWEDVEYLQYTTVVEKSFRNVPKQSIGKTIPIQIGNLTDSTNGVFGKTVTTNEKTGLQKILLDYRTIYSTTNIGVWETGSERYFEAKQGEVVTKYVNKGIDVDNQFSEPSTIIEGEYEIHDFNNTIIFRADSEAVLTQYMSSSPGTQQVYVDDVSNIEYTTDNDNESFKDIPESITANVLSVGQELLLVVDAPNTTSNTVVVERGYNGTEVVEHQSGETIYQAAKYSAKNYLFFSELFSIKSMTDFYYANDTGGGNVYAQISATSVITGTGSWGNVVDEDTSLFQSLTFDHNTYVNFNATFEPIEKNWKLVDSYVAGKIINYSQHNHKYYFYVANPSLDTVYNHNYYVAQDFATFFIHEFVRFGGVDLATVGYDTYTTKKTTHAIGAAGFKENSILRPANHALKPQLRDTVKVRDTRRPQIIQNYIEEPGTPFKISSLTDLNKKWKYSIVYRKDEQASNIDARLYNLGFWCDFIADYTKEIVVAPCKGRKVIPNVSVLTGEAVGDTCEHPLSVCATILMEELGYDYSDFGAGWEIVGYDWTHETTPVLSSDYEATWKAGTYSNNRFVVVSDNDSSDTVAQFSDDGKIWVRGNLSDNEVRWEGVTHGVSTYVAVGATAGGVNGSVMTSPTGQSWGVISGIPNHDWRAVVFSLRLSLFIAVGEDAAMTSPTGATWTDRTIQSVFFKSVCINEEDTLMVAVGTNGISTSTNAITWTPRTPDPASGSVFWLDVTHGNGLYVMVGYNGSNETKIQTSPDAITWTERTPAVGSFTAAGITYGNELYYIVSDGLHSNVMVSVNAIDWTMEDTDYTVNRQGVVYGDNKFVALSSLVSVDNCTVSRYTAVVATPCAFSYGVGDKRKKGFEFVSEIANHYNYLLTKNYYNELEMTNLYDIYNDTGTGYEIKIEDILFLAQNSQRRMVIYQTGNELIYNDIIVKYSRNNSTGEYQKVYTLPDAFEFVKADDKTLRATRDDVYEGKKRTLEIESPYIYDETVAQYLAETKANEFADIHLYIELYIDFDHYTDINSLGAQYKVGDVIYLTGTANGITFDSNRKFYISSTAIEDTGREININMKSVEPCWKFTSV